jgi:HD-GYP domain-containing protein (c-di-GMP phosphodiesterase class II)
MEYPAGENHKLIEEISVLKRRNKELEQSESERKRVEEKLQESLQQLRRAVETIIQVLVMAVEVKDPYTAGHQRRMTNLARAIAEVLDYRVII